MSRRLKVALFVLLAIIAFTWLGVANPFNFFVRRSADFSEEEFLAIKAGTRIEDAINQLGAPIQVVRSRRDLGCPGCVAYYFLGDPPSWLLSFQEAWLLVDRQGRVVTVTLHGEP